MEGSAIFVDYVMTSGVPCKKCGSPTFQCKIEGDMKNPVNRVFLICPNPECDNKLVAGGLRTE